MGFLISIFSLILTLVVGLLGLSNQPDVSVRLASPLIAATSKTFIWEVKDSGSKARPLTQVSLTGCWNSTQVETIEVTDKHKTKVKLDTLHPDDGPIVIAITFRQVFTAQEGAATFAYKQGSQRVTQTVAGPDCRPVTVNTPPVFTADAANTVQTIAVGQGLTAVKATDKDNDPLTYSLKSGALPTGISLKTDGSFSGVADVSAGDAYNPVITVSDGHGGSADTTLKITVTHPAANLPPDPATIAPATDISKFSSLEQAASFLYAGDKPVQTDVTAGAIEPQRIAVLRGKVLDRSGKPLPGVTVTIANSPKFGKTLSRADGMFDMAVNGGGIVTISYQKQGYLPVQRSVDAPWRDYRWAPDVVMTPLDSSVTDVTTGGASMQTARGTKVSDDDGARQATILFPSGTTAQMTLPDGTKQALTHLHVRATEYTSGQNGPEAMPASLPATSGYTYAAEYSADEAIAANAKTVTFNKAVPTYTENFLNFPVGGIVPTGYYDRDAAQWVPSDNGRVVKIMSITNGKANLSVESPGIIAASPQTLTALGITDEELQQLATLYPAGTSLWRVPVTHFTPWDHNWPYGPPADASAPDQPEPEEIDNKEDDPCKQKGSIIECQNQVLGEQLPITGTPLTLNYRSDRVPGRKAANAVRIPLSGGSVPASLKRIVLEINVAGQQIERTFSAAPNQQYTFAWDGRDAYGRQTNGGQTVSVKVGYTYGLTYQQPAEFAQSFGAISGVPINVNRESKEITLWQNWEQNVEPIGTADARGQGLGGWDVSVHHSYDSARGVLYLGDGSRRSNQGAATRTISTIAGTAVFGYNGDGIPASQAQLYNPHGMAVGPDGSVYIADMYQKRIRKISPDGIITTVAGNGQSNGPPSGDGGLATQAALYSPSDVSVGPDGSLYITDGYQQIRRVTPDGIIHKFAGVGGTTGAGFSGDGGPATDAMFDSPGATAVSADGTVYILDYNNFRIRKVSPSGIVTTVAGNGEPGFSGDGGPASKASINYATDIATGPDGSLYIGDNDNFRIRRVSPDGIISTIAGTGQAGDSGDGGPATQATLGGPVGSINLAVGPDNSVYFTDMHNHRIRRVAPDGTISAIAGSGVSGFSGDGGPARQAAMAAIQGIALAPDGSLYVSDSDNLRVRKISPAFPYSQNDTFVASDDGNEVYFFGAGGRHTKTVDSHTGAVRYSFGYDSTGHLASITDGDGKVTGITHDAAGNPTGITGPFGQKTALATDANGFLSSVTNPANETTKLTYSADGLLHTYTDPRNQTSTMTYDSLGRLAKDQNAAGGSWSLDRNDTADGYSVVMTSAMGRSNKYTIQNQPTGDKKRSTTDTAGLTAVQLIKINGDAEQTASDGTVTAVTSSGDPRFGMQAPTTETTVKLPGGLTQTQKSTRTAKLNTSTDLLSLVSSTSQTTLNSKTSATIYDAAAKRYSVTSAAGRQAAAVVDSQSRPVQLTISGLAPQTSSYNASGQLTTVSQGSDTEMRTTTLAYNPQGLLSQVTDPENQTQHFAYDAADRLTQKTFADGRTATWTYDANGNITSVTPASRPPHGFTYTALNQQQSYAPPAITGIADPATRYEYNADNQLTKVTRPGGVELSYGYDDAGRLSTLTQPDRTLTQNYSSTTGQLTSITSSQGVNLAYTYDGKLPLSESWSGPVAGTVTRGYNSDFNTSSITVNGSTVEFTYENDGLPAKAGELSIARSSQNGLITGTSLGPVTTNNSYNSFGEISQFTTKQNDAALFDVQYQRDKLGRITQKTETLAGATNVYAYAYDAAGRLAEAKKDGTTQATYQYDTNGNRLSKNDSTGTAAGTYDDQDRMTSYDGASYTYTDNGDLKSKTKAGKTANYTYDAQSNLTAATLPSGQHIEYLIDGHDRRVGKKINGVLVQGFLYQDQLRPIAELDGNGAVVSRFVYGSKDNVPDYMIKGGVTYRIVSDHLGSPRLIVNTATGAIVQRLDYDEFGVVVNDTNPGFQPFGFAGGIYDRDTGLVRFGTRDYDAGPGRWTTKDPLLFNGGDSNMYLYANGDPVNYIDPDGHASLLVSFGIAIVSGFFLYRTFEKQHECEKACEITQGMGAVMACGDAGSERQDVLDALATSRIKQCAATNCALGVILGQILPKFRP